MTTVLPRIVDEEPPATDEPIAGTPLDLDNTGAATAEPERAESAEADQADGAFSDTGSANAHHTDAGSASSSSNAGKIGPVDASDDATPADANLADLDPADANLADPDPANASPTNASPSVAGPADGNLADASPAPAGLTRTGSELYVAESSPWAAQVTEPRDHLAARPAGKPAERTPVGDAVAENLDTYGYSGPFDDYDTRLPGYPIAGSAERSNTDRPPGTDDFYFAPPTATFGAPIDPPPPWELPAGTDPITGSGFTGPRELDSRPARDITDFERTRDLGTHALGASPANAPDALDAPTRYDAPDLDTTRSFNAPDLDATRIISAADVEAARPPYRPASPDREPEDRGGLPPRRHRAGRGAIPSQRTPANRGDAPARQDPTGLGSGPSRQAPPVIPSQRNPTDLGGYPSRHGSTGLGDVPAWRPSEVLGDPLPLRHTGTPSEQPYSYRPEARPQQYEPGEPMALPAAPDSGHPRRPADLRDHLRGSRPADLAQYSQIAPHPRHAMPAIEGPPRDAAAAEAPPTTSDPAAKTFPHPADPGDQAHHRRPATLAELPPTRHTQRDPDDPTSGSRPDNGRPL